MKSIQRLARRCAVLGFCLGSATYGVYAGRPTPPPSPPWAEAGVLLYPLVGQPITITGQCGAPNCSLSWTNPDASQCSEIGRTDNIKGTITTANLTILCNSAVPPIPVVLTATNSIGQTATDSTTVTYRAESIPWTRMPDVKNWKGHYTAVVPMPTGPEDVREYTNATTDTPDIGTGNLYMRSGSFTRGMSGAQVVISTSQITDQFGSPYMRTNAVVRGASGRFYALLHLGNSYGLDTSWYYPAWATSDDGVMWTYHGKLVIDGIVAPNDGTRPLMSSSAAALVVQEEIPEVLDSEHPGNNRFVAWEEGYCDTVAGCLKLVVIYSADGVDWRFYRDSLGRVKNVWPTDPLLANDYPVFTTATKSPYGFHLITGNRWAQEGISAHRHLFSCDGVDWKVVDLAADTYYQTSTTVHKGTNLGYQPLTRLIHAMTTGSHWALRPEDFPEVFSCP